MQNSLRFSLKSASKKSGQQNTLAFGNRLPKID
jgi:hypothetical protein